MWQSLQLHFEFPEFLDYLNARARIFCRKNEAELLAIDGYYRTTEDIDASLRNRPIQAWLDGDVLKVAAAE